MMSKIAVLVCALQMLLSLASVAQADGLSEPLGQIASGDHEQLMEAISTLGQSGDERALLLLRALQDKQVKIDPAEKRVLLQKGDTWVDAATEAPASADGLEAPLLSNTVRRAIKPAIAGLSLKVKNREVRLSAALELSDNPVFELRDEVAAAAEREQDAEIRDALRLSVARIDISSDDTARVAAAVATFEESGRLELMPELERVAGSDTLPAEIKASAKSALRGLQAKEFFVRVTGDLIYGISLGSVLMLAALGLAITFGLMGVINMAHGEMLMIGAYAAYGVQSVLQEHAPESVGLALPISIPVAFILCTLVGVALERTVLRFLYGRPLETLLATWGISLGLIQTIRLLFGAQNVAVATPEWLSGGYELLDGVVVPYNRIAIVMFTVLVVTSLWATLNRTSLGLNVRAVTQNRTMAAAIGIRTARVDMWTFGLGSGLAGLGGVALSQIGNVGPELGQGYIVDSFMVVVLGGVGKLAGTVVAALGIGVINKLLEPISGAVFGKILVLGFIILFIQRRPQGLFALRGRMAEG